MQNNKLVKTKTQSSFSFNCKTECEAEDAYKLASISDIHNKFPS